ncbi:MAG: glycosyltransferase family 4 protein, partial [Bdellovibrionales bacterium]|nr:glycosyltransferase family 4 protein [Bdellovibrionales bacterium]
CVLPFFDRILAVSKADLKTICRTSPFPNRVGLHLNGIQSPTDVTRGSFEAQSLVPDDLQSDESAVHIGWIGRLSPEKNPLELIAIDKLLREMLGKEKCWRIHIFGDGPLCRELRLAIEHAGANQRLRLYGYQKDLRSYLPGLDIVLNTSRSEGLPISLLEAAHLGIAICSRAIGGIADLASPGIARGIVASDGDIQQLVIALASLIQSKAHRRQDGEFLQKRAKKLFNEKRWKKELLEHYRIAKEQKGNSLVHRWFSKTSRECEQ